MIVGTTVPHYYPAKIFILSYTLVSIHILIICIIFPTINIFNRKHHFISMDRDMRCFIMETLYVEFCGKCWSMWLVLVGRLSISWGTSIRICNVSEASCHIFICIYILYIFKCIYLGVRYHIYFVRYRFTYTGSKMWVI